MARATAYGLRRHPALAQHFPYLIEVVNELATSGYNYTEQFERGLDVILDGIERTRH